MHQVTESYSNMNVNSSQPQQSYGQSYMQEVDTTEATGSRGGGYGLDAELARKQDARYDHEAETLTMQWLESVTGYQLKSGFYECLKDGVVLCNLINRIHPNTIKKIETSSMPFKQMENISNFLRATRTFGVAEFEVFETVDLYESKDLGSVIRCLNALSRAVEKNERGFRGPYLNINFSTPVGENVTSASTPGLNRTYR